MCLVAVDQGYSSSAVPCLTSCSGSMYIQHLSWEKAEYKFSPHVVYAIVIPYCSLYLLSWADCVVHTSLVIMPYAMCVQ